MSETRFVKDDEALQRIGAFREALRSADEALDRVMILAAGVLSLSRSDPNEDARAAAEAGFEGLIDISRQARERMFIASQTFRHSGETP